MADLKRGDNRQNYRALRTDVTIGAGLNARPGLRGAGCGEAIALMKSHHVAQIPVFFEGAVLGMISHCDG